MENRKAQQPSRCRPLGSGCSQPGLVIWIPVIYLGVAWALFLMVDVLNVAGAQEAAARRLAVPITWYYLFQEGGATEILQWLLLGGSGLTGAFLAGLLSREDRDSGAHIFWALMALASVLMLIEDAGNPRHYLASLAGMSVSSHLRQTMVTLVEMGYYSLLASVPLYALWRHRSAAFKIPRVRRYLILGYLAYATASIASATRHLGEWYSAAGQLMHQLLGGNLLIPPGWDAYTLNFFLVDWLVEESVELLGAAALFASALAFLYHYFACRDQKR